MRLRRAPLDSPGTYPEVSSSRRLTFPKLGYTRGMSNILQSDIWARFQESNGHTVIRRAVTAGRTLRPLRAALLPVQPVRFGCFERSGFRCALASLKDEAEARCLFARIGAY